VAIRLVLIDDHPLVLNGLAQLLGSDPDFEVVAMCGTAAEGLRAVAAHNPDVLLLDLALPDESGLSVLRRLDPTRPPAVVVLTASQDEGELLDAARLGARGIVLKAMAPRGLEQCVRAVHHGGQQLVVDDDRLAQRLAERRAVEAELENLLTVREIEILRRWLSASTTRRSPRGSGSASEPSRSTCTICTANCTWMDGRRCWSISARSATEARESTVGAPAMECLETGTGCRPPQWNVNPVVKRNAFVAVAPGSERCRPHHRPLCVTV
jgi:DNA-binding NarL/FixJ family response regulator